MMRPRRLLSFPALLLLLAAAALAVPVPDPYACDQHCCCKVCSAQSMDAFPYGLPVVPNSENVDYPRVIGATCGVPVWSAYPYNNTDGTPITNVPNKLFWTNRDLFGDMEAHVAPTTCSCCQLSVHTSCSEAAPLATRPKTINIGAGTLVTNMAGTFTLEGGVELSETDIIQLRRDTYCGYNGSSRVITAPADFTVDPSGNSVDVNIIIPAAACYSVCYYHSTLTTPTWYLIGSIVVNPTPAGAVTYTAAPEDVLLSGNVVTLTFSGMTLLSPFDDLAEIRNGGGCGTAGYLARTGQAGADILQTLSGAVWCSPAVVPRITAVRPLRRIAVKYTDCATDRRVYLSKLSWAVRLPVTTTDATWQVCYRRRTGWTTAGNIAVRGRRTQLTALRALRDSTAVAGWAASAGWMGANECAFHGVRCDAGKVVSIHLGRNRLLGPLPETFFLSDLAGTLTLLALDMNNITGTIPPAMGAMKALEFVDFGFNQMTGTLPVQLLGMPSIDVVYISNNAFTGSVPPRIDKLSLQWLRNSLVSPPPAVFEPECPVDTVVCVDQGSTAPGVFSCGYDGITELECTVMGCCFNAQAPLVFGGTTCFTKRSRTFFTYPQCVAESCVTQADVIQ